MFLEYNFIMKKFLFALITLLLLTQPTIAWSWNDLTSDEYAVKKLLKSQVKYANRTDFDKFINTYDSKYINADGFNLDTFSSLIKDIWSTYNNIKYDIEIKNISIKDNNATVNVIETSYAKISMNNAYDGELKSSANTEYKLKKINGKWKVVSDKVLDETTTMLYGEAKNIDIQLIVPKEIEANKEYCATLEFVPPKGTLAIASIASDIVEYPQKPTKEVFRALPEDNILERLFTSNSQNANEYVVASIGLTKTSVCSLNINLSLTGFGYAIKRVNVIPITNGEINDKG